MVDKTQKNSPQDVDLPEKKSSEASEKPSKADDAKTQAAPVKKPVAKTEKKKSGNVLGKVVLLCFLTLAVLASFPRTRGIAVRLYREKIYDAVAAKIEAFKGVSEKDEASADENGDLETVAKRVDTAEATETVPENEEVFDAGEDGVAPKDVPFADIRSAVVSDECPHEEMQRRIDGLEKKNALLEMQLTRLENEKADTGAILSLMARLADAEKRIEMSASEKEKSAVTMMALALLQNAALSGQSFQVEQRSLAHLTASSVFMTEKMAILRAYAEKGVWTQQMLQTSFDEYARKTAAARFKTDADARWWQKSLASLKSLIIIRRTDADKTDTTTGGVLAQAQKLIDANDLQGAVLVLKNLNNSDVSAMMPWISAAERTLIVQKTINEMIAYVLSQKYAN